MNVGKIKYSTYSSKPNCVFVDNKELPLISIDIWCKAGSSFEDVSKNGTAHFLEHMIFKGNNKILPGEFDQKIESLGGISNASTGYDDAHYYVLIPPTNFKESLALLTNIVLSPSININEFNKEKNVVIDEIKQQNDQPEEKLFNFFLKRVWGNHNYAKSILGTEKSVKSLEIFDLENFHRNHYVKEKICIAIAGNLSEDIYRAFEQSYFPSLEEITNVHDSFSKNCVNKNIDSVTRTGKEEVVFDNLEFARIFMAWKIPSLNDQKNIIGLEILAAILSVGRNSRLVKVLKEENNLVESVYVDVNAGELDGLFIIEACCEKKNLNLVEKKINQIIDEINSYKNLNIDEIRKATNIVRSNYVFNLETSTQLTSFFGNELLWGRKYSLSQIESHIKYWDSLKKLKNIINFITKDKFTMLAYPN
tara:strand:+ start:1141 stop:2403 length:1263 start_codon:yes stop_codon:yes gene_type:complete